MLLLDVYGWATPSATQNQDLKKQLAAAIATAAVQVLSEAPAQPNHANRILWAKRVLVTADAPLEMANQMIWGVLGNTTIQGELQATPPVVPDGDLQFTVATLIDVYAP